MPWKTDNLSMTFPQHVLFFLLAIFFLAGCAQKPWTDPLKDTDLDSAKQLADALLARDDRCNGTLEGDVVLTYQNALQKKKLNGFLQFSMPSSYKFVMTNPFGQPVMVVAGNEKSFQAINTMGKSYLTGSLRSFGLRNDIPVYFLKSDWTSVLTGRNQQTSRTITDISKDRDSRGIWLTFQSKNQEGVYRLLLDREQLLYRVLIIENGHGKTVAQITYDNWVTLGDCRQPQDIHITGLDYGTDIRIMLSNVLITDERKTFQLSPPQGYRQQYLP